MILSTSNIYSVQCNVFDWPWSTLTCPPHAAQLFTHTLSCPTSVICSRIKTLGIQRGELRKANDSEFSRQATKGGQFGHCQQTERRSWNVKCEIKLSTVSVRMQEPIQRKLLAVAVTQPYGKKNAENRRYSAFSEHQGQCNFEKKKGGGILTTVNKNGSGGGEKIQRDNLGNSSSSHNKDKEKIKKLRIGHSRRHCIKMIWREKEKRCVLVERKRLQNIAYCSVEPK